MRVATSDALPSTLKRPGSLRATVLRSSFVLLPRVGLVTEARLWGAGVTTWDQYREGPPRLVRGLNAERFAHHRDLLAAAEAALGRDPAWFAWHLPNGEQWRAFDAFGHDAVYLDIETEGRSGNAVTVVGLRRRGRTRQFVAGDDLDPAEVSAFLDGCGMIVTFNGASFDVPILKAAGVEFPLVPHLDLLPATRRLGLRGGLKKVEVALGLARGDAIAGLTGWDAVRLWGAHLRGDRGALRTLLEYNAADVENLEPLARVAVARLTAEARAAMAAPIVRLA